MEVHARHWKPMKPNEHLSGDSYPFREKRLIGTWHRSKVGVHARLRGFVLTLWQGKPLCVKNSSGKKRPTPYYFQC